MEKIKFYYVLFFLAILVPIKEDRYTIPNGEIYILGEDGIKRIYVNIWGHVKNPGTYLVYENIDMATLLSMAGGPLDGANLKKIEIIKNRENNTEIFDFDKILKEEKYKVQPYDTIRIKPTGSFYLKQNASVINVIINLISLSVALNNN